MIDIHSHILPGIDDGSRDMEMTLVMLRNAEKDGTREIVATPHYLLEYGEATISEVKSLVQEVNSIISKEGINIKVYSGQEVYFNENIINNYLEGKIGTINDSMYMLVEFSMHKFDDNIFDILYELQVRNVTPIIAHPERYKPFREDPSLINEFIDQGYLFQMNAGSITGRFGESIRKTAHIFLENNIYNFIGSDAHDINNRTTGLRKAIHILNDNDTETINENIFEESSKKLINNEVINFVGKKVKIKKSIFSFFRTKSK